MVEVVFYRAGAVLTGFNAKGHAMFDDFGRDIVCAAISSAIQLCANGITEVAKVNANVKIETNYIKFHVKDNFSKAEVLLKSLQLHLDMLAQSYPDCIAVTIMEGEK